MKSRISSSFAFSLTASALLLLLLLCYFRHFNPQATKSWPTTSRHRAAVNRDSTKEDATAVQVLHLNVLDWGVTGDGIQDDTEAMRRLLAFRCDCHKHIVIPEHTIVKTFPLNMTSHTTLQVDGKLTAVQITTEHWPILPPLPTTGTSEDRGPGGWLINQYQSFIYASHAQKLRITGIGTIDGGGPYWWNLFQNKKLTEAGRPNLIQVVNCTDVEIDKVTLKDSAFWTLHPILSDTIHIHHLKIRSPLYSPNVDGIDPDSCHNVVIEYNDISCGDDHIAIKAGVCGLPRNHYVNDCRDPIWATGKYSTENVTVRHNIMRTGMGIAIGSESSGSIRDVLVYNNTIGLCQFGHDTDDSCGWGPALHIKTTVTRSGEIANVIFQNNTIYNTSMAILVETNYQVDEQNLPPGYPKTNVHHIVFDNNRAIGKATGADFHCNQIDPCHDIVITNNIIQNANAEDNSPWSCKYIDTYSVLHNYPEGLIDCMANSMNGTYHSTEAEDEAVSY